jgi:teichuronic acid exporter
LSNLRQKSVTGVAWALMEKFGVNGVKFVLGIILARLLSPEDFGLIGMITVFFVIAEVFVDSGFAMAYVQKKQINDADADTVFYTNLMISIFLYIVIFLCAPLIAHFYKQPQLILLTRIMAVVIIINSFNVIQKAQIIRDVNFKKLSKVTLTSSLLSGTIGIVAAYNGMGVWALVLQSLCSRAFIGIGFWFTSDYRPEWRFSKQSFKEMFSFGSWMLFSSIIRTFFDNIYIFAIGRFFPVAQLGYYSKAKQLVNMSSNNIAGAIGSVAFPVYSSLQNDKERLGNAMQKFIQNTMFIIIPLLAIFIVVAKPFIILLLTEKWAPMIPVFQVICFAAIMYPLNQINAQSLIALGKGKLSFKLELGRNLLRLVNIVITYKYGVIFMIVGEVIISVIFFFINVRFNQKYTNYGMYRQLKDIWKIIFGGVAASSFALIVMVFIDNLMLWLIAGILITGLTYLLIEYLINRELINSSLSLILNFRLKKL